MNLSHYSNLYPVSKTLRFRLIPMWNTLDNMLANKIIEHDEEKQKYYPVVKKLMDEYHKQFIEETLSTYQFDNGELTDYYNVLQKKDGQEERRNASAVLRKGIAKQFTNSPKYNLLFSEKLVKEELINIAKNDEDKKAIDIFKSFTTYFQGFYDNRKNMYKEDDASTGIAYRIVDQNFPKYANNVRIWQKVKNQIDEKQLALIGNKYKNDKNIELLECFEVDKYGEYITQSGIDKYNCIIGGYSVDEFTKIKGLNEIINEYNQKNGDNKIPKMQLLFKQILSDRQSNSFLPEQFESDNELLKSIQGFYIDDSDDYVCCKEVVNELYKVFDSINSYDLSRIYISNDSLSDYSNTIYGSWDVVSSALIKKYDETSTSKNKSTEAYLEKRRADLKKVSCYSISEIKEIVKNYSLNDDVDEVGNIRNHILGKLDAIKDSYSLASNLLESSYPCDRKLSKDSESVAKIKNLLDAIKDVVYVLKWFVDEGETDVMFYSSINSLSEELSRSVSLYNKVRNYLTKKPYSNEKMKINFDNSQLLGGWDRNKEADYLSVILKKGKKVYLGIIDKSDKKIFANLDGQIDGEFYEKMDYKLLPDPSKTLPHVFFSKKGLDTFKPSDEVLRVYKNGTFKTGSNFSVDDCHKLIDYYKDCISKYGDWPEFDFSFSDTSTYRNIGEFFSEVKKQGYKLRFKKVSANYVEELVKNGKLYLFQIYNKDMSEYSKGKKNLHTMYFESLFDHDNLDNVVYQLNGGAEMFFRKASLNINDTAIHKSGEAIKNKNPLNSKKESLFDYDLIKDRRYTLDQFYLHLPITMNFKADANVKLNNLVLTEIKESKDLKIIGIDRGERNLLDVVLIDSSGNILEQKSLNIIDEKEDTHNHEVDYHRLLDDRERGRNESRKAWKTIEDIKNLKEGYLSQAVHKVVEMIIENNAIVALEDLNSGFKNSRAKVEKQVYQKFEKMLIEKLNYYVDKKADKNSPTGLFNALQLTNKFESFSKMGKQNGIIFYVPAWLTSKIDPTTGFANLLKTKFSSINSAKVFISSFDDITYNCEDDYYEFHTDYDNFEGTNADYQKKWTICTYGKRIDAYRDSNNNGAWTNKEVSLVDEYNKLFEEYKIDRSGDLKSQILNIDNRKFHESLFKLLKLTLQMRNSVIGTDIDYLISPVKNKYGKFFCTNDYENYNPIQPADADSNGAYHIAMKALWISNNIRNTEDSQINKVKMAISNAEWLEYMQKNR